MSPETGLACSFRTTQDMQLAEALDRAARAADDTALASWWSLGDRDAAADRSHDPMLGLQVVATATRRLRVVVSGDIPSLYSAPVRAKQIATLDWFSQGRAEHGVDLEPVPSALTDPLRSHPDDHVGHALDQIGAMRALWTERRATHTGPFISFTGAIALPKPKGDRVPATHVRATGAEDLARYVASCGAPDGWVVWSPAADDVDRANSVLDDVLADRAGDVRRTWVVPATEVDRARGSAPDLGVDEVVGYFDEVPTPDDVRTLVA
ncbi:LLM class flavin-dependent oxidoreductase [Microbacterium koreense]|uniref:LLM class flavin-dependent oxidoreductase n=1 Tax=Microbacterium koreense TaxID=323761 RepID=A0ABW2ZPK7_9MICO